MTLAIQIFAVIAALLHIVFFIFESLLFMRPHIYPRFLANSQQEAEHARVFAYNQGFYNLLLALGCFTGLWLARDPATAAAGQAMVLYVMAFMLAASLVLVSSERHMLRAALMQGLPPLIALVLYVLR
ncbi:MAG: DUF1304 domain-containing protein [Nevskiales bacterium]